MQAKIGDQTFSLPNSFSLNSLYLSGNWHFENEFAKTTSSSASIVYHYSAKNVYFVASADKPVKVKVLLDGKQIPAALAGKDVAPDGTVTIKDNRLYDIVEGADYGEHTLLLQVESAGLNAFTFTFG